MSADVRERERGALASLRRYAWRPVARERCELCSADLHSDHAHLLEMSSQRLCCACEPCAILFSSQGAAKYRRVPRDVQFLADFRLSDIQWASLDLPINLAFLLHSSSAGRIVALYPSPGGATEFLPAPEAWQDIVEDNPLLRHMEPDVEALLVNRLNSSAEYYQVGIDQCYMLVGLVRTHWHGLSGGTEVWEQIASFFTALKRRAPSTGGPAHV